MKPLGIIGFMLLAVSLSGCSTFTVEPEETLQKFNAAMAELSSFHYTANLDMKGNIPSNLSTDIRSANFKVIGEVDAKDLNSPTMAMDLDLTAEAGEGSIRLGGNILSLSDYTYFRLSDFSLPTFLPISLAADSKWYRLKHPATAHTKQPNRLGVIDASNLDPTSVVKIKQLLGETNIFEVLEAYPDETVNGARSYHFKVKVLPTSLKDFYTNMRRIVPTVSTPDNLEDLERYEIDLWVNKRNYVMSRLKLSDKYFADGTPIDFDLSLDITKPNTEVHIAAPGSSQELETSKLKGLPSLGL